MDGKTQVPLKFRQSKTNGPHSGPYSASVSELILALGDDVNADLFAPG